MTRLLTIVAAAEQLSVSTSTVKRLLARGDLKRLKIGSATRIAHDDVEGYVARLRGVDAPGARETSTGQLAALHAKANDLDRSLKVERGTTKARALEHATETLGRPIRSAKELTFGEMSELLDWLDAELGEARKWD